MIKHCKINIFFYKSSWLSREYSIRLGHSYSFWNGYGLSRLFDNIAPFGSCSWGHNNRGSVIGGRYSI